LCRRKTTIPVEAGIQECERVSAAHQSDALSGITEKLTFMISEVSMTTVPLEHGLILAAILFALGLAGVLVRRNIVFMLMSIEVMLNAVGLAFVVAGARWQQVDGQVMFLFILTMAAAEVSVGLALVLQMYHRFKTLDADVVSRLKG
jgi:NADH-quinone oxidoreductase subunit K